MKRAREAFISIYYLPFVVAEKKLKFIEPSAENDKSIDVGYRYHPRCIYSSFLFLEKKKEKRMKKLGLAIS